LDEAVSPATLAELVAGLAFAGVVAIAALWPWERDLVEVEDVRARVVATDAAITAATAANRFRRPAVALRLTFTNLPELEE
jgi:hypothetical protein